MTFRAARLSSYKDCVASLGHDPEADDARKGLLQVFSFSVMLELSYPEMDFTNRWCWESFGPRHGECFECRDGYKPSDYPMCDIAPPHSHKGKWTSFWFGKTDYDFGFNEWYFADEFQHREFLEFEPRINGGEKF